LEEALAKLIDTQVDNRRSRVASGDTLERRLLLAVGDQAAPLLAALGPLGEQPFMRKCELKDLARIVLRHLGPAALGALSETLDSEGLAPPARWGTEQAREFVRQIGFPDEFGQSRTSKREPEEWSQGPYPLPPLHDFQVEVRDGIKAMIDKRKNGRRAVVSLPTGGGKTRVTVESAVEFTLKPKSPRRGVLWIAQTDELCEQAVQAFRQVWPNRGAERTGLRICRLWGGNPTPALPEKGEPFVVVASIQTMDARGGLHGEEWATRFGMLVIDECHHAITPSYTRLLKGLGFDARAADEGSNPELIILGLSATPFRMNDEESRRLAGRFANRWFPKDQESLHRRLLEQGVLCKVASEELRSGAGLNRSEEEEFDRLYTPGDYDGIEFERLLERINQRLGDHEERNHLLVERIRTSSERSILFFANSVSHSYEIAARLNLAEIPAAAVSGETPRSARRYFLDQFQRGELRVLCNHSVLTTGFDAPKTDMLLIARQVFSPVRYMQMVGRGLRGVKNGGTEQCRIVTVLDNLGRFEEQHPYHYCRHNFEDFRDES
jgi:superfamily II DNA or RNA helicase